MKQDTLNRATMLEHCIQHLTEMSETCWNMVSNNTNKDICFSNNAANTNTQQSPPLTNFLLKQIKAKLKEIEGYKDIHFLKQHEHILMKKHLAHTI